MQEAAPDRVASLVEAAKILGVSVNTVKRMSARGEVTILRISPRRVGVRLSQLMKLLDSREVAA
jgi:transposase